MEDVRFTRIVTRSSVKTFQNAPPGVSIQAGFRKPRFERTKGKIAFLTTFIFRVIAADGTDPVMVLTADTELIYAIPPGAATPGLVGRYTRFVLQNGVFHLWPYWRELVQTALNRLGLPVIRLPIVYHDDLGSFLIADEEAPPIR